MIKLSKNTTLLFQGDSITDGGRGKSMDGNHILGHGYSYIISAKLSLDNYENMPKFINKGVSGESLLQIYSRLNMDILQNKPDIISFLAGVNDIAKSFGEPEGMASRRYIKVYKMMLEDIKKALPKSTIIICEPFFLEIDNYEEPYKNTPYVMCEEFVKPMNIPKNEEFIGVMQREIKIMQKELKELAKDMGCIYVPLQEEFLKYAEKIPLEYLVWDNVHPTACGHEVIARKWLEVVEKELES